MVEETRAQVSDPSPKNIRQIDPTTLEIIWTDGHESVYSVRHLRKNCPCASCIDEWTGEKRIDPSSISENIQPLNLKSVGLYAIQFFWNDGHDTGFYSHKLMRKLCQCGECNSREQEV